MILFIPRLCCLHTHVWSPWLVVAVAAAPAAPAQLQWCILVKHRQQGEVAAWRRHTLLPFLLILLILLLLLLLRLWYMGREGKGSNLLQLTVGGGGNGRAGGAAAAAAAAAAPQVIILAEKA